MNISLKQLRAFVTVAECQSFTKAANEIYSTQSAVSVMIRELEEEIGFRLLDRTTRQVVLSEAGRDFYQLARKLLDEFRNIVRDASDIAMLKRGVVRVGATEAAACSLIVPAIAAFERINPGVDVRLSITLVSSMFNALRDGEVDYIIGPDSMQGTEFDDALQLEPLVRSPIRVWFMPEHVLAKRRSVSWEQLLGNDLIIPAMDFTTRITSAVRQELGNTSVSNALFEHAATRWRAVSNITVALSMARAGLGVTFAAEYIRTLATSFGLEGRPLVKPDMDRVVALYSRRGRVLSPAASHFLAFFRDHLHQSDTGCVSLDGVANERTNRRVAGGKRAPRRGK